MTFHTLQYKKKANFSTQRKGHYELLDTCWSFNLLGLFSLGDFLVPTVEVFSVVVDTLAEDFMVKRVKSFEIAGANFVQGSCVE